MVNSLVFRIEDGIISSLANLFDISLDELTDLDRVRLWKQRRPVSVSSNGKGELVTVTTLHSQLSSPDPMTFSKDFVLSATILGNIALTCRTTSFGLCIWQQCQLLIDNQFNLKF
ncbi:hypothetical protein RCL1_000101 [Eukaryota sp. TZLM3-RCL]